MGLAGAPALAQAPAESLAASEQLVQERLPALEQRRASAEARLAAARRYFAGELPLAAAFPDLAGAPLGDPTWLAAELARLSRAAETREAERVAPLPEAAEARLLARVRAARSAALDAEAEAEAARVRLLAGLRAGLARAPGLQEAAVQEQLETWAEARAAADGLPPEDPGLHEAFARVQVAGEAEARLRQLQEAARREATVPEDPALDELVAAELAALSAVDPAALPAEGSPEHLALGAAVDRLQRAAPLLEGELSREVGALLQAVALRLVEEESAALREALETRGLVVLETVAEVDAALAEAEAALERAVAVAEAHPEVPAGLLAIAEKERDLLAAGVARDRVRALREHREILAKAARRKLTEEDIEERSAEVREVEAAAAEAKAQSRDLEALLLGAAAEAGTRTTEALKAEKQRREAVETLLGDVATELEGLDEQRTKGEALIALSSERREKLSAAYEGYHDEVMRLAQSLMDERARARSTRQDRREQREWIAAQDAELAEASERHPAVAQAWTSARAGLEQALDERQDAVDDDVDALLDRLHQVRERRRAVRSEASREAQTRVRSDFLPELTYEVREIPVVLGAAVRGLWALIEGVPAAASDLTVLGRLFSEFLTLFVVLALWLVLRQQAQTSVALFLESLHEADPRSGGLVARVRRNLALFLESGDVRRLEVEVAEFAEHVLDWLAATVVFWLFHEAHPVLGGFLPLVVAWRSLLRAAPEAVDLLVAPEGTQRPAMWRVGAERVGKAQRSLQLVILWQAALSILGFVGLELLDADRMLDLVATAGFFAGWIIVVVLLRRWQEELREALEREERTPLIERILKPRGSVVLQVLASALSLGVLLFRGGIRLGQRIISRRAGLAWLGAALARQQLREVRETRTPPLPPEVEAEIRQAGGVLPVSEAAMAKLRGAVRAWLDEPGRSLIAVSGDRGMGRQTLLSAVSLEVGEALPVVDQTATGRARRPADALGWLASATGVTVAPRGESLGDLQLALIEALSEREPAVFVLDGLHNFVIRDVGGFTGLRRVLAVLHATSDRHLWVCGFHGPTWAYLTAVAAAVNLDVFRTHVQAPPVGPEILQSWLQGATEAAGYNVRFDHLSAGRPGTVAPDPERARQRATEAYWRFLADASHGNPEAARCFWLDSIGPAEDRPRTLDVGLFETPDDDLLEALDDRQLFILASLIVHDGLGVDEVATSMNLPSGAVRATVRQLESAGVLQFDGFSQEYTVRWRWLPVVERLLRTRSLLHKL